MELGSTFPNRNGSSLPKHLVAPSIEVIKHQFPIDSRQSFKKQWMKEKPIKSLAGITLDSKKVCGMTVTMDDIDSLKGRRWLNGDVIDVYINYIKHTANNSEIGILNSYFVYSLSLRSMEHVMEKNKKTLGKMESNQVKTILAPVVLQGHWTLCMVDGHKNRILYYDSLYDVIPQEISKLGDVMVEIKVLNPNYTIIKVKNIPKQNNGRDCGVFVSQYARCILHGINFDFNQADIPHIRKDMELLLKSGGVNNTMDRRTSEEKDEDDDEVEDDLKLEDFEFEFLGDDQVRSLAETLSEVRVSDKKDDSAEISIAMMGLDVEDKKADQKRDSWYYNPDVQDLKDLRLKSEPFVDLDKNGEPFTRNTAGSFKNSLILSEALMMLGEYTKGEASKDPAIERGWKQLEVELVKDISFVMRWLKLVNPKGTLKTPFNFVMGKQNFFRLKQLIERLYPFMEIKNPHGEVRRGGKKCMRFKPY